MTTVLHAGGKFGEGGGYKVSGGLHGVGSIGGQRPLHASSLLEVDRDGDHHEMEFVDGGKPHGQAHRDGSRRRAGAPAPPTTFWPDPTIFEEVEFRAQTVVERLQVMAFLNQAASRFDSSMTSAPTPSRPRRTSYKDGIADYVKPLEQHEGGALSQGLLLRAEGTGDHGGRHRHPVERRLLREHPLLCQRYFDHRRWDARGGVQASPSPTWPIKLRAGQGQSLEGKG
jgi:DNA gyrase/topoisomerase IV subunit B